MSIRKTLLYVAACVGFSAVCLVVIVAGLAYRYLVAGVNPFREMKAAAWGESIEIKDHNEPDGRQLRQLLIDGIDHGSQYSGKKKMAGDQVANWSRLPTSYYHRDGPVGMAFSKLDSMSVRNQNWPNADSRLPATLVGGAALCPTTGPWSVLNSVWSQPPVGVIMMNNGTLAAYARPYQFLDFYESNPGIVRLSLENNPSARKFTYIEDAKTRGAHVRLFAGPERQTFEKESPKNFYHLLIVDTSRGHPGLPSKNLLTREAWKGYLEALTEDGVVCVHTSSRDFDLAKLVASTTQDLGLAHLRIHDGLDERAVGHYTSEWVLVARQKQYLSHIIELGGLIKVMQGNRQPHQKLEIDVLPTSPGLRWTDAGANSLAPVRR
ncbi:MAG: hypothetical protein HYX68_06410 [Planctomycetes bacterium]|nr:hypothetical protein [Planctomycetota bacterium]